jgi:hypothetical protein
MRAILADVPALADDLIEPTAAPLLAPLVSPPLSAHEATGLDLILEGFLLHHGRPRHLRPSAPGREVLAGDYCYAHGLVRIAAAGDLFVVEALADLIALGAGLVAAGERGALVPLWRGTTAAILAHRGAREAEVGARFLDAQRSLRADGDASQLAVLAAELPPTPELEEALSR